MWQYIAEETLEVPPIYSADERRVFSRGRTLRDDRERQGWL